ncbi:MAG: amidohydrolase family protein [Gemmatimonadales bacterium]
MLKPLLLVLFLASTASAQQTVIDRVTVIDGTGGAPLRNAVVVIEQGRIRAVGPSGSMALPAGAERIDGGGGYLVPGFVEMHAHVALGPIEVDRSGAQPVMKLLPDPEGTRRALALLLASGITTARDPGGPAVTTVAVRDSVADGQLVGPRLFVAGEVIDRTQFPGLSRPVETPDEVRREVRRQAALGVDMIKLYAWLTPELVQAGIEEAHRFGIPAIAHLMNTTWTVAARSGLDGIVHVVGWSPELLPERVRARYHEMQAGGSQFLYGWLELVDLDAPELDRAVDALAARRMHLDPTLVVFERAVRGDDPAITQNPHLAQASPALLANWRAFFTFSAGWTKEDFARARAAWPKALGLTKKLYDRGVLITAGTDANNPWTVPGESYHRELELLVEAGIPPLDVLRIATRNGAEALGILAETGTIEAGKRADLVLLAQDPTASISATRSVQWVMQGGARHDPAALLRRAGVPRD